ncbi:gluconate 2-dehydrogenase alpha chain [Geomicrobium halophilum]|uniref:Gluconate 2-dehydrogenase alpha chain n=1 Tax=Geomicrobium halophilum TaxID=549000 RepID=A0A841PQX0_9BACL|nr:GMC family oxidoreductase [Geomicrobium halophilum]MBB6451287.1 gluconate 2-dehydrogenase alpha chain [Geomicrobium halophilum]
MPTQLDKVDVLVVGSGWAGGIVSAEMAKAGYQVVCLERGDEKSIEDYIHVKDELRFSTRYEMMQNLSKETVTSRHKRDITALPVRMQDSMIVGNDMGGGSVHWAGATFRFLPYDFEIYSRTVDRYGEDKIPEGMTIQDWGITYDEFEEYYTRFEKTAGISGEPNPIGPYRSEDYPNPPMVETPNLRLFKEAAENLGYHPYAQPSANITEFYENPDGQTIAQCQYCAFCDSYGCDYGAKADPLVTVLPTARETGNFELRAKSNVRRVLYDGNQATGVIYVDTATGNEYEQPADVVVLAGFTFTNTRLLLLSEIGTPYNPDTRQGVIGKNFTGQFSVNFLGARAFFNDKKFNLYMGAGGLGATFDDYSGDSIDHTDLDFIHGGHVEVRQYGDRPIESNSVPNGTPSWGREFKEKSLFYANRNIYLRFQHGVMPWYHNYLDLDPTYTDFYGDPLLRVTNEYTDQDRNLSCFGIDKCREVAEEMGADIVDVDEVPEHFSNAYIGAHYAGGVIMGNDPETSAVNSYLQMWDAENLFVVGASAYPHFPNYHPTKTVGAMAYRAADGIEQYLDNGGGLLVKREETKINRKA